MQSSVHITMTSHNEKCPSYKITPRICAKQAQHPSKPNAPKVPPKCVQTNLMPKNILKNKEHPETIRHQTEGKPTEGKPKVPKNIIVNPTEEQR